jgi:Zn-dependent protease with chaperone function
MDILKGQMLAFILAPPILAGFLAIVQKAGDNFFYYLWLFGAGLQVFMITIYPITILPLFNKLSPLEPGDLKTGVEALAERLKFPLHELYVIDGSKRSAHSNAYFFGMPWKKHIVIYDTLIEKSETQEVVAVLAHELGHWSLGHTTRLFGISQVRVCSLVCVVSQVLIASLGTLLLYLCSILRFHQQPLSLSILRLPQPLPHYNRLHPLLRRSCANGHSHQALDEYPQPKIRVPGRRIRTKIRILY